MESEIPHGIKEVFFFFKEKKNISKILKFSEAKKKKIERKENIFLKEKNPKLKNKSHNKSKTLNKDTIKGTKV